MQTTIHQVGEIAVVQVSGKLTLEKNEMFRAACLKRLHGRKVVFALEGLQFVGSTGIQIFFRTLADLHLGNPGGVKIAGLKADFLRLFHYTAPAGLELHPEIESALRGYSLIPASPEVLS